MGRRSPGGSARFPLWLVLLFWALTAPVRAAVPVVHVGDGDSMILGDRVGFLVDQGGQWHSGTLLGRLDEFHWRHRHQAVPNFGLDAAPLWMAVRLQNDSDRARRRLFRLGYPMLDRVDLYVLRDGRIIHRYRTGDRRPFGDRPIDNRNFVFPLRLPADGSLTLLMRVETEGSLQLPLSLWKVQPFFLSDMKAFALQVAFGGVMAALAIYNLLLFFMLRRISYLWYVCNVVFVTLALLTLQGVSLQYLWPRNPWLNNQGLSAIIGLDAMFVCLFAHSFLNVRRVSPFIARALQSVAAACVVLVISCFFIPYSLSIKLAIGLISIGAPTLLGAGIYLWWRGEVLARLFTLAWGALLCGHTMVALDKLGALPASGLFNYAPQIGAVLEVLLLSFALGSRINLERRRRSAAQQEALRIQRQANEELEAKVAERTSELAKANERLRELSAIDGLTNVKNRLWFEQTIASEWSRGCRDVHEMGLLLIDVDYFKRVNDTYGHQCGDACLQHMARIVRELARREGDEVARYGGEEFVVLLPKTSLDGCVTLAESIREAVAARPLPWEGQLIPFTISVGVAACVPEPDKSFDQLIRAADEALYAAKGAGRNCVIVAATGYQDGVLASTT